MLNLSTRQCVNEGSTTLPVYTNLDTQQERKMPEGFLLRVLYDVSSGSGFGFHGCGPTTLCNSDRVTFY